ncbi:MAG: DUF1343 domain-containing protein [Crocinitomicaceae bacterium]|nr:DUF1343 domain-containing protein [Crocinitomicaceae bacterium]
MKYPLILITITIFIACSSQQADLPVTENFSQDTISAEKQPEPLYCNHEVKVGAEQTDSYLSLLKDKRVAVVGNQSSMIGSVHLVDSLKNSGINLVRVFSPEHGFRGDADAGEKVASGTDEKTGLQIVSLYGSNRKPTAEQLADVDILLFDIQDVGARFYTYISTLHYVMEAAAENGKKLILLDRPNPNGHYVDGPVLDPKFKSFVGMHPVPVVHGLTIGEYAQMINGEGWLANGVVCDLSVIKCEGWDHSRFYELPIAPSPNLQNMTSIYLYPSLCFFEGTVVSIGRGTDKPFQVIGHPKMEVDVLEKLYSFKPMPNAAAAHPVLEGETCYGYDLSGSDIKELRTKAKLDLSYLVEFYNKLKMGSAYFLKSNFINNLAGTDQLKSQILAGKTLEEIEASWQSGLNEFKEKRKKYLLYTDFEN